MIAEAGALVLVAGYRSDTAANRLQQKGDDVAGDEYSRVGERFDVGIFGAEGYDDAGEGEVDSCS